jgi:hypothetical protein
LLCLILLLQRQWEGGLYGGFCVTTGFGVVDEWAAEFEKI